MKWRLTDAKARTMTSSQGMSSKLCWGLSVEARTIKPWSDVKLECTPHLEVLDQLARVAAQRAMEDDAPASLHQQQLVEALQGTRTCQRSGPF